MEDIVKSYYVTDKNVAGHDIKVDNMEELVEALKVVKNEWKHDHAHVQIYGSKDGGKTNTLFIAEFTIGLKNDIDYVTFGI